MDYFLEVAGGVHDHFSRGSEQGRKGRQGLISAPARIVPISGLISSHHFDSEISRVKAWFPSTVVSYPHVGRLKHANGSFNLDHFS